MFLVSKISSLYVKCQKNVIFETLKGRITTCSVKLIKS